MRSWYTEQLKASPAPTPGLSKTPRHRCGHGARFGLGLAPEDRNVLKRALEHLGEDKLVETGMLIQPEEVGKESYDRFRGRLMIPIRDPRGRVIAFGGRILGEGEPKYLNSPDTPLFDKGRTLYNLDRAGPASRAAKRLIVVEGYMDVIALDRAGIAEAVAPNGTASPRPARADVAPRPRRRSSASTATMPAKRPRSARRLAPFPAPPRPHAPLRRAPAGQDPDDVIRDGGRDAFEALLANPEPLDARLWRHELEAEPLTTPEAWAGLKERLIAHASAIGHADLARIYREDWLNRFFQQRRPEEPRRRAPFTPQRRGTFKNGRFVPPEPPVRDEAKSIASSASTPPQPAR